MKYKNRLARAWRSHWCSGPSTLPYNRLTFDGRLGDRETTTAMVRRADVEPYFDGYRGSEEERAGGVLEVRRGLRDDEATKGGTKSGLSSREDFVWVENVIRIEKPFNIFHRLYRLVR